MADTIGEDLLQGMDIPCLLKLRTQAQQELFNGVIQSTSAGDTTTTRFQKIAPEIRIRLINKTLNLRDPNSYPVNVPIKRTRAFYQFGT